MGVTGVSGGFSPYEPEPNIDPNIPGAPPPEYPVGGEGGHFPPFGDPGIFDPPPPVGTLPEIGCEPLPFPPELLPPGEGIPLPLDPPPYDQPFCGTPPYGAGDTSFRPPIVAGGDGCDGTPGGPPGIGEDPLGIPPDYRDPDLRPIGIIPDQDVSVARPFVDVSER